MATEAIDNSAEYREKKLSEEEIKQDCESKAFVRIAEKSLPQAGHICKTGSVSI